MNKKGPIIYVEDDEDDVIFFVEAMQNLKVENEIKHYRNGKEALKELKNLSDKPFLIISDINMPVMGGLEFRNRMQKESDENLKSVPFIFFTTGVRIYTRVNAYADGVQGYFLKPSDHEKLQQKLKKIIDYWNESD